MIRLPWDSPPLTLNARQHHHAKAKDTASALILARIAIRAHRVEPVERAEVVLHFRPVDKRRRDADNLAATLKVVQDALVAEGVLVDDGWQHVPAATCRIHPPTNEGPAMWVELIEVPA